MNKSTQPSVYGIEVHVIKFINWLASFDKTPNTEAFFIEAHALKLRNRMREARTAQ